ncbi:hypothetical protein MKW98_001485 [Papaver atlanticum]|uniref:Uncharacterized protein n=1 Tax=Papaver atlanticum TaxID=357466 RepID=A0AAD4SXI7_9MAGN|nr:hypothetical protein MKW98_001485 [Papaver atlanticum]
MLPHAGHRLQFIELVFNDKTRDENVSKVAVWVLDDLADALDPICKLLFKDKSSLCAEFLGVHGVRTQKMISSRTAWPQGTIVLFPMMLTDVIETGRRLGSGSG